MRLKLTLQCRPNGVISTDYAYALRGVIYRILQNADPVFATWLHESGYTLEGDKSFKLFTFDRLRGDYKMQGQTIRFLTNTVEWQVSFHVDKAMEKFVEGLFKNQRLEVATHGGRIDFEVKQVQLLPKPIFTETMRFRAMMPICITEKTDTDRYAQYRFPNDAPFETLFFNNLKNKYQTAVKQNPSENASDNEDPSVLQLKILGQYRTAKFEVPQGFDKKPIEVRGATFDFEITAPTAWLEVGYAAGFGEKNGSFGFCEVIK